MLQTSNIMWVLFVVHKCKMVRSPGIFFHFFKIFIFRVISGVKGGKMTQNDKHFSLLHPVSQKTHIIWFSFLVQRCKMIISAFYPKLQKYSAHYALYLTNHTSCDYVVYKRKMMIYPGTFFIFSTFWFSRVLGDKDPK